MRAISFDVTVPRYLLGKSLGRVTDAAYFGALSGLSRIDMEEPELPGPEWARVEVLKAGICGTDLGTLTFGASPALEPFGSFPAVLGHEILGRVVEMGPDVTRVEPGQRVAVDPVVSCTMRGYGAADLCPSCAEGLPTTCARVGEEGLLEVGGHRLRPGMTIGFHADLPGGWTHRMIVHQDHLFPVDPTMDEHAAALIEPLSVGMHAVLGIRPWGAGPALVIGSGPIALGTVWALRAAGFEGEVVAQTKRRKEAELALAFGATSVVAPGDEARDALVATGAQAYMPIIGEEVFAGGGFPLIFDCVGSGQTLDQALRYAAPRGRIVLLGCAAEISKLDLTFTWARELEVKGFVCYGRESWRGREAHTFEITHDLVLESGVRVQDMVTHVYPLSQYREALSVARNRRKTGSIKVLLDPTAG